MGSAVLRALEELQKEEIIFSEIESKTVIRKSTNSIVYKVFNPDDSDDE